MLILQQILKMNNLISLVKKYPLAKPKDTFFYSLSIYLLIMVIISARVVGLCGCKRLFSSPAIKPIRQAQASASAAQSETVALSAYLLRSAVSASGCVLLRR